MKIKSFSLSFLVLVFVFTSSSLFAWTPLFEGSPERCYMQHQLLSDDFELQKDIMKSYFLRVNGNISPKRAKNYSIYVKRASERYHADPFLVASIMVSASDLVWTNRLNGGYGLMMVDWDDNRKWIGKYHEQVDSVRELFKPSKNISIGAHLLVENLEKCANRYDEVFLRFYCQENIAFRDECFSHYKNLVRLYAQAKGDTLKSSYSGGNWQSKWNNLAKERR